METFSLFFYMHFKTDFNPIQDGLFWGWWRMEEGGECITASANILASGNISLKLFMAPPSETIELLIFWYVDLLSIYQYFGQL